MGRVGGATGEGVGLCVCVSNWKGGLLGWSGWVGGIEGRLGARWDWWVNGLVGWVGVGGCLAQVFMQSTTLIVSNSDVANVASISADRAKSASRRQTSSSTRTYF